MKIATWLRRTIITVLCLAVCAAGTAQALEFSVVSSPLEPLAVGDVVTIDIVLTNLLEERGIYALGASVHGWDPNHLQFLGGEAVSSYLNSLCVGPGICFAGLTNAVGGALVESEIGSNGPRVQIALSATIGPLSNIGAGVDQGLDQEVGTAMFRLRFAVLAPSVTNLFIGTEYQGDGFFVSADAALQQQAQGATVVLVVLPEPGTAILLGLGLMGLAARGPRLGIAGRLA